MLASLITCSRSASSRLSSSSASKRRNSDSKTFAARRAACASASDVSFARRTANAVASAASFVLRSLARRSSAIRLLLDVEDDADKSDEDGAETPTAADSETVLRVDVDEADIEKAKQHVTSKSITYAAAVITANSQFWSRSLTPQQ